MRGLVLPVPGDDLAAEAQARADIPELAVAVRRLMQIHVVHVNPGPGQVSGKLGVEMQHRLLQRLKTGNPHLGGAKGVHPADHARARGVSVRLRDRSGDFLACRENRFGDNPECQVPRFVQPGRDGLGMRRNLGERLGAVEVLTPDEQPGTRARVGIIEGADRRLLHDAIIRRGIRARGVAGRGLHFLHLLINGRPRREQRRASREQESAQIELQKSRHR